MITNARPKEDRGSHFYTRDGQACYEVPKVKGGGMRKTHVGDCRKMGLLPSPTTILRVLNRPQLNDWVVEQAVLAAVTSPRREGEDADAFIHRILHVDQEHNQERDAAADQGTAIHNAIQLSLEGLEYDHTYEPHVKAVRAQIDQFGRAVKTETILIGDAYAGRTDAILEDDETITVVDFKGCNKVPEKAYDEAKMQVASYAKALGNTGNKRVQTLIVYINRNIPGDVKAFLFYDVEWQLDYQKFELLTRYWYLANNVQWPHQETLSESEFNRTIISRGVL
jgi:hypothetical protein